ncbi:hypothetical protein NHX12_022822, partial [Muraenolepis orangiensis]
MDLYLGIVLTLAGLTGSHSLTTVSQVSVRVGDSVSIPCLYGPEHRHHVKCLCKGYSWATCTYEIKTDPKRTSSAYTISDHPDQLLFTVTITSQQEGEQHYWCAVEINNGADQGQYFQLLVSKGVSSLRVDQQYITGSEGDGVEISCHYAKKLKDKIGWCKLGDCEGQRGGVKGGLGASINTSRPGVAVVTMTSLRMDSSGCESFDLKHLLIPGPSEMEDDVVYSSVVCSLVKGPSEMEGDVVYSSVVHHLPEDLLFTVTITSQQEGEQHYWCAVEINNGVDQRQYFQLLVSEGVSSLRVDQHESFDLKHLLIPVGVLLFTVLVALMVWWKFHTGWLQPGRIAPL